VCNGVLACLGVLSDVDSEHDVDIEDSLSWDESDPESKEVSDCYSEISASESDSEKKQDVDSGEIVEKDGYVWSQKPKAVRRTPMRNSFKEKPGPEGNGCQADTPLKSFELFYDDTMITEIVTWTNQKIENVKTSYTSKPGFLYNTTVTENDALIGILPFLGATKNSKEITASIWAKDGTGKPICITAIIQKRFFVSCVLLTL